MNSICSKTPTKYFIVSFGMTLGYGGTLETVAEVVGEEDDSVGELGSVSTSREPSRGAR